MTPIYRADIDGLRAIAVLAVLFFHSGISLFSGGYVGVDIFFVISGYLITTIIIREIANDNFSIVRFYERRFRRILPALAVVTLASLMAGFFLLTPEGLSSLGKSVIATALFSSNMLFYFESGYFDGAAEMKPLLHTWSLAVEEQYYIFFPLLLLLIARFNTRHYLSCLLGLGMLSFIACIILTERQPSAAFYWIPPRAWELFIGSILALRRLPTPTKRILREIYSLLGISLITYSIFQYSPNTRFPGIAATLPTIGAALIIWAGTGGHSIVSTLLSQRVIVFIGLISYSLYLWHWPIIVYTKIFYIKELTEPVIGLMFIAIFSLAILSWRYVESPFRKKQLLPEKNTLLIASGIISIILIVSGLTPVKNQGFPQRFINITGLKTKDPEWHHWGECQNIIEKINNSQIPCDIGANSGNARFILWGDSHARAIASGLDLSAKKIDLKGTIATRSACPPLFGIERPNRQICNKFNQTVLQFIAQSDTIDTVFLAARWALATKGTRYKQESGKLVHLVDIQSNSPNNLSSTELFELGLTRTINALKKLGKKIIIVNSVPEVGYDVPSAHLIASLTGRSTDNVIAPTVDEYKQRTEEVRDILQKLNAQIPITIVHPEHYLCTHTNCQVTAEGRPLYRDDDHLSTFGSHFIASAFDNALQHIAQGD